jgi:hypothetical protein
MVLLTINNKVVQKGHKPRGGRGWHETMKKLRREAGMVTEVNHDGSSVEPMGGTSVAQVLVCSG